MALDVSTRTLPTARGGQQDGREMVSYTASRPEGPYNAPAGQIHERRCGQWNMLRPLPSPSGGIPARE